MDQLTERSRPVQILALDGGGAKALFTAHVLARLEADTGTPISDHFDLIAGTSAGGIIALALGAGISPAEIVTHYERLVPAVFPTRRRLHPRRLFRPGYTAEALRESLHQVYGGLTLGQSSKRLVIPSWNVSDSSVHLFKTPHHERFRRDYRVPMVDVALATSAAPTFFPAARVDGIRLVDGGVWANNPSVVAIAEAGSVLGAPLDAIKVLNIGTTSPVRDHATRLDTGGFAQWAATASDVVVTAGSRGTQGTAQHLLAPNAYHRFDAQVPPGSFALDRIDHAELAGIASGASRRLCPVFAEHFSGHTAPAYTPAHLTKESS